MAGFGRELKWGTAVIELLELYTGVVEVMTAKDTSASDEDDYMEVAC